MATEGTKGLVLERAVGQQIFVDVVGADGLESRMSIRLTHSGPGRASLEFEGDRDTFKIWREEIAPAKCSRCGCDLEGGEGVAFGDREIVCDACFEPALDEKHNGRSKS